jgi:hypothetical protein
MAVLKYYNTTTSAWEYIAASTTANFTTWKKTAAGGETSVSGTDDNAVTLSYTVGLEQVFINGVLQVRGSDYTATDGTSVTGLAALVAGDIVTVVCYAPFNVANTIAPTVVDAKGDLIVGTADDTVGRLAVGTNGQLLSAASGETTGLKWANGGLTLINTTSFSAVASQSINDVFSSTYKNYRIIMELDGTVGASNQFLMRLRNAGSDLTSTYNSEMKFSAYASASNSFNDNANATDRWILGLIPNAGDSRFTASIDLCNPFTSLSKTISGMSTGSKSGAYRGFAIFGGENSTLSSYSGFTIYPASGNMTGSVSVYGYNL